MNEADKNYLLALAVNMRAEERLGEEQDEPEGARFIKLSHTLAVEIADRLIEIAHRRKQKNP